MMTTIEIKSTEIIGSKFSVSTMAAKHFCNRLETVSQSFLWKCKEKQLKMY